MGNETRWFNSAPVAEPIVGSSRGADLALALEGMENFPRQLSLDSSDIEVMLWSGAPFRGRVGFLWQLDQARESQRESFERLDDDSLCKRASEIFEEVFSDLLDAVDPQRTKTHYLPLSGGRDSGTILAFLLRSVPRNNIVAITYRNSQPFSEIDFMVGRARAKAARIRHLAFDLRTLPLTTSMVLQAMELTGSAKIFGTTNIVHGYMGIDDPDAVYWTGFMGDPQNRLLLPPHLEYGDNVIQRLEFARKFAGGPLPSGLPFGLPDTPFIETSTINLARQLNYVTRQDFRIREGRFSRNHVWVAPFLHSRWAGFALNLPPSALAAEFSEAFVRRELRTVLHRRDEAGQMLAQMIKTRQKLRAGAGRILSSGHRGHHSPKPRPSSEALVIENFADFVSRRAGGEIVEKIAHHKGLSRSPYEIDFASKLWSAEIELALKAGLRSFDEFDKGLS